MADIAIYVSSQLPGVLGGFRLSGEVLISTAPEVISWGTPDIAWTATSVEVNQAVQDAAIAAVVDAGHVVSKLDHKIVSGGSGGVM